MEKILIEKFTLAYLSEIKNTLKTDFDDFWNSEEVKALDEYINFYSGGTVKYYNQQDNNVQDILIYNYKNDHKLYYCTYDPYLQQAKVHHYLLM